MIIFKSNYTEDETIKRWDEYTSLARFAGSDESMDLIFVSKRKENKVKLIRRAKASREPFSMVFRGKIVTAESGCEIRGVFTKSIIDYFVAAAIMIFLFYIRSVVIARGESPKTIGWLIAIAMVGCVLLLFNFRSAKRRYAEFICRITGVDVNLFKPRHENKD